MRKRVATLSASPSLVFSPGYYPDHDFTRSHGQRFSDRGLFSCPIPQWQVDVINLNGAGRHGGLVQGRIVVTRLPQKPRWSPQSGHSWSPEIRPTGRGAFRLAPKVEKGYGKDGGHGRLGNREAISTFPQPLLLVSLSRTRRHLGTEIERPMRPDARV